MLKSLKVDQVNAIIGAANALNMKYPPSTAGINVSDITAEEIQTYNRDEQPLVDVISSLGKEARMELMGLMWIGRGDQDDFREAVEYARKNSDEGDVPYITEKASALPTYHQFSQRQVWGDPMQVCSAVSQDRGFNFWKRTFR